MYSYVISYDFSSLKKRQISHKIIEYPIYGIQNIMIAKGINIQSLL